MATQAKLEKERQALIEKYGDVVLVKIVDHFFPTYIIDGEDECDEKENIIAVISLSNAGISNTADLNEIKRIIMEGKPRTHKMVFQESEKLYNSPEQKERREKLHRSYPPIVLKPAPNKTDEQSEGGYQDSRPEETPVEE